MSLTRRFLIGCLLLVLSTTSCIKLEEVEIQDIKSIKLLDFSELGLVVESNVQFNNPNSLDIKVVDSGFDVYVKGTKICFAQIDGTVSIPGNSTEYHKLILRSSHENLSRNALPLLLSLTAGSKEKIDFKIDGYIVGKAFLISKKVEVHHEGEVPLKLF